MSVVVTFEDRGLQDLRKRLSAMSDLTVTVGFQGPDGRQMYPTGINVATVAMIQEFGTRSTPNHAGIPARSFLRATLFEQRQRIERAFGDAVQRVVNLEALPLGSFTTAGREVARLVRDKIDRSLSWARRNAQATIQKKGFDYPLHETERMRDALSFAVRSGGAEGPILVQGKP